MKFLMPQNFSTFKRYLHTNIKRLSIQLSDFQEFSVDLQSMHFDYYWAPPGSDLEKRAYSIIGYNITLKRQSWRYICHYILPALGLDLVTSISFWIPPTAIPGRISLLVTMSLTLTSIFTSAQVLYLVCYSSFSPPAAEYAFAIYQF